MSAGGALRLGAGKRGPGGQGPRQLREPDGTARPGQPAWGSFLVVSSLDGVTRTGVTAYSGGIFLHLTGSIASVA